MATSQQVLSGIEYPVFLVGAERSGTTLLRLLLDHHPEIAFLSEFEYSVSQLDNEDGWPDLDEYTTWLSRHRGFCHQGFTTATLPTTSYVDLVKGILEEFRQRSGKPIVGATVHHHFDRLLRIWPNARFIHLLRDGRDVARSNIPMGWAGNVWTGVNGWIEAEHLWSNLKAHLPPDTHISLTYEELMERPEQELTRLCDFVNVSFDPDMLAIDKDSTYDPPDPSFCYQWKRKLSARELGLIEGRVGPMLEERGYSLSGYPSIFPGFLQRLYLRLQDRVSRIRFRFRKFGMKLVLVEFISRKLGLSKINRDSKERIKAIVNANLK